MESRTTLQEALGAWRRGPREAAGPGEHVPTPELYELYVHPSAVPDRQALLAHLTRCPACQDEFAHIVDSAEAAEQLARWDFALSRAAASDTTAPHTIATRSGLYTIEIRPHLSDANRGIIAARVAAAHREELEGKTVTVVDSSGRALLQGRIINGEASQEIDALDRIKYGLVVRAD